MTAAFGGWVLDHHAVAAWARVEPYPQSLVWSAMEVGMSVAIPVAVLPHAHGATRDVDHDILRTLFDLPVTLLDPLTAADAPELGDLLAGAASGEPGTDALAMACVVQSARRRGWPVLSGRPAALRALDATVEVDELP